MMIDRTGYSLKFLALVAMIVCLQTTAIAENTAVEFNIKAQELGSALNEFALQSGKEILFDEAETSGKFAPRVTGTYEPGTALELLLAESTLNYRVNELDTILVAQNQTLGSTAGEPAENPRDNSNPESEQPGADMMDEILVTGSRIARTGFDTPTPVQVVDSEMIENSGFTNIDDVLLRVPSVGVGLGSANTFRSVDAGAAFVNLRGLGTNRSLTVVNGRRRVSGSSASSAVDLNTIPVAMIERVEVITGGASAIYGADAVSGVVNIITKTDFDGLQFSAAGGTSANGGADSVSFSLFGGTLLANDQGSLNFGVSYNRNEELRAHDRDFGLGNAENRTNPANTGPNDGIPDRITTRDDQLTYITYDANFFVDNTTYIYTANGLETVGDGTVIRSGIRGILDGGNAASRTEAHQLRIPNESLSFRSNLIYPVWNSVNFFAMAEFTSTEASNNTQFWRHDSRNLWLSGAGGPRIQLDNPFLPAEVLALMTANGLTELPIRKSYKDHGFMENIHTRQTYTIMGGLEGQLSMDWEWQAFYQYGNYTDSIQNTNTVISSNFLNAVDVIADPVTGEPVCRDVDAQADGCVPYNLFVRAPLNPELRDYIIHTRLQDVENTQTVTGIQFVGDLLELPAGMMSIAVGAENREETLKTQDDGLSLTGEIIFIGLGTAHQPVDERFRVTEAYVEILAPIVVDGGTGLQSLDIEGAFRYSDYNTIGTTSAWKLGTSWRPIDVLRFRVTHSKSVRAPNLNELFAPQNLIARNFLDPCDVGVIDSTPNRAANCAALGAPPGFVDLGDQTSVLVGGNPGLKEETSTSWTVGAVATLGDLEQFLLSVDYWDITIEDAVTRFDEETVAERCVDAATINNPFCPLMTFGPDFNIDFINIIDINASELSASGIDFSAQYSLDAFASSQLTLGLTGTYLLEKETLVDPTDPTSLIIEDDEFTNPKLRFTASVRLDQDQWNAGINLRFISESELDAQATPESIDISTVDSRTYADLYLGYQFDSGPQLSLSINNVFDEDPPFTYLTFMGGSGFGGTQGAALYDNIGRFYRLRANYNFD